MLLAFINGRSTDYLSKKSSDNALYRDGIRSR
jgi:hypothetical protein